MRPPRKVAILWVAAALVGCSSASGYEPRYVGPGELTLRYDDGLQIWAAKKILADSPAFGGLADYVRCVSAAAEHAEAAESDGSAAVGTGWAGGIIGVAGLGGLAGLGYLEQDEVKAFAILGTGVAAGLLGISLALISRSLKNTANGHAVDAVNYYNDDIGSLGGSCDRPPAPLSEPDPEPVPPPLAPRAEPDVPPAPLEPEPEPPAGDPAQPAPSLPPGSVVDSEPEPEPEPSPEGVQRDVPVEPEGG